MNTDKELKNHIIYEFFAGAPNRENILFESRGVVNGLHNVVKAVVAKIYQQVRDTCSLKTEIYQIYTGKLEDEGLTSFFNKYKIEITTRYGHAKDQYRGGFYPMRSFYDTKSGVACDPDIEFSVTGDDVSEIIHTISFALGHELTHAYNLLSYANKNGLSKDDITNNWSVTQGYKKIKASMDYGYGNEKAVANTLYNLNRMERNAYLAQLKQELEDKSDVILDSRSAWKAVTDSESYKKFKNLETNIGIIFSPTTSEPVKHEILNITKKITGKEFKNYNQVKKFYGKYWNTWKKKYLSTAAKIVHDIFDEHNMMMDGNNLSEDLIINPNEN